MEIEKIYNNADNYEVMAHVVYLKYNINSDSAPFGSESGAKLYKDKKFSEPIKLADCKKMFEKPLLIKAIDTNDGKEYFTFYPIHTQCMDNSAQLLIAKDNYSNGTRSLVPFLFMITK